MLESDQNDFHPTDVIEDADGSLLVADTGSWYMICCPTSKVAKPGVLGAIYRIERKNGSSLKDPRGLKLDWKKPQVEWLSDKRPAVVKRAIDILAKVGNADRLKEPRPANPPFGRSTVSPASRLGPPSGISLKTRIRTFERLPFTALLFGLMRTRWSYSLGSLIRMICGSADWQPWLSVG